MKRYLVLTCCAWFSLAGSLWAVDAGTFGFSPEASGLANMKALQKAVDLGGTITVDKPGVYKLAGTVYVGSNTSLRFGNNVIVRKVDEAGKFSHVILNKGALTKTYDENITIEGLHIEVNNMDVNAFKVYGLRGQLAFFYVKDLKIDRFRCYDLGKAQYCIHICTFEDITVNDVIIKGFKDGVHLGKGKRFTISNGVFDTGDDAVALNAHDYSSGNPELGWIEDGCVVNCHDLPNPTRRIGYFCRILAGAWVDWKAGMEVQQSDTIVADGKLYRVQMSPDGKVYKSVTRPTHTSGAKVLDGITWGFVQNEVTYTVGVRNVVFRDIFLGQARTGFSVHFDHDRYSRSYYPGAPIPRQENIVFDNVRVLHKENAPFLSIATPVDTITCANCSFRNNRIVFVSNRAMPDYGRTQINMNGCIFFAEGPFQLIENRISNKAIQLKTAGSLERSTTFTASVSTNGIMCVDSDLTGLRK